ncbi:hypothetical protein CYL16_03305 [Mycobacterium sp. EPG1]|nr:hypothetical protein CYL16_03305 [Mycobacterium sp. EPG1]
MNRTKRNKVQDRGELGVNPNGKKLYTSVPMPLARDGKLSHSARSVALYVWSHDDGFGQSRNDIAEALGMSVNTASKALDELQDHGWLVRNQSERIWYRQRSNTPFTADEIQRLSRTQVDQKLIQFTDHQLDQNLIQSEATSSEIDPVSGSKIELVSGSVFEPRSSRGRSAPEVHFPCSSGTGTGAETAPVAVEQSRPSFEARPVQENPTENELVRSSSMNHPTGITDPFADAPTDEEFAALINESRPEGLPTFVPSEPRTVEDPFAGWISESSQKLSAN